MCFLKYYRTLLGMEDIIKLKHINKNENSMLSWIQLRYGGIIPTLQRYATLPLS